MVNHELMTQHALAIPVDQRAISVDQRERVITHIIDELETGRALYLIIQEDSDMPARETFRRWCENDEELQAKVARAREAGVETHIDEALVIADDSSNDVYIDYEGVGENRNPVARIDGDAIQRAKLRIETRFKRAAMIAPRKYGNKLDLTTDGEKLPAAQVTLTDARVQSLIHIAAMRRDEMKALGLDDE